MAQEVALRADIRENKEKHRPEADVSRSLGEFLRGYSPDLPEKEKDVLERRWQLDLNTPLPEFDCKSAKAYATIDRKHPDKQQYVAHICEAGSLPRTDAIAQLINNPHPNLMAVMAAGVVEISRTSEERFVIIYERPKGKKLSTLIASLNKRPSFEFICSQVIAPLALAIQHINELGLTHGSVNCDNIYFHSEAVLGHFVVEPCGFSQPFNYEPLERMQALPAGKGAGTISQDYYALAVVVLYIIYGANHFVGLSEDALIKSIMKEGAFNALTRQKDMPEVFYDFFRGLLGPNSKDRWGYKYLKAWLDGKRYNVMPAPPPQEAIRPFEFEGGTANTRREVAYLFSKNWAAVPDAVSSGQMTNWVAISLRNKELNEYLIGMARALNAIQKNDIALDEQIMRVIAVFDHTGPVRIRKLAFNLDGMNSLFAELVLNKADAEVQSLMRFIELSMFNFIVEQRNKENEKRDESNSAGGYDEIIGRFERMRAIIRNAGLGFGVERILYDLNPNIQCLSPLLAGKYVATLPDLLKALDQLAPTLSRDKDPIDAHIAAFIASRLNINHDIRLNELRSHPILAKSHALIALKLLAAAQRKSRLSHLSGLTHWLALRILPLLGEIRSKTLKRKILTLLEKTAKAGSLPKMAEVFIESGYNAVEESAFLQASRKYKANANDILYYQNPEVIEAHSRRLGTNMAHYVALAALALSFYLAIRG